MDAGRNSVWETRGESRVSRGRFPLLKTMAVEIYSLLVPRYDGP